MFDTERRSLNLCGAASILYRSSFGWVVAKLLIVSTREPFAQRLVRTLVHRRTSNPPSHARLAVGDEHGWRRTNIQVPQHALRLLSYRRVFSFQGLCGRIDSQLSLGSSAHSAVSGARAGILVWGTLMRLISITLSAPPSGNAKPLRCHRKSRPFEAGSAPQIVHKRGFTGDGSAFDAVSTEASTGSGTAR